MQQTAHHLVVLKFTCNKRDGTVLICLVLNVKFFTQNKTKIKTIKNL